MPGRGHGKGFRRAGEVLFLSLDAAYCFLFYSVLVRIKITSELLISLLGFAAYEIGVISLHPFLRLFKRK